MATTAAADGSTAGMATTAAADGSTAEHTPVLLRGLQSKPELNGQSGCVLGWDARKGRYNVMLDSDGEMLALKPECLSVAGEAPTALEGYDEDDDVEEIFTPGAAAPERLPDPPTIEGGWRPAGPPLPAGIPSFIRERMHELHDLDLGESSEEEEQAAPTLDPARYRRLTVTVLKMGKLGMRITDSDGHRGWFAQVAP